MSKRPNISILENTSIHVDEKISKKTCCMLIPSAVVKNDLRYTLPQKTLKLTWLEPQKSTVGYMYIRSQQPSYILFLPVWHICPVKPGEQKQENTLTPSLHVPPCRQGWLAHSSMPAFKEMKKKWQKNKTNNCNGIQIMMIISTSVKRNVHFFVNTLIHGSGA